MMPSPQEEARMRRLLAKRKAELTARATRAELQVMAALDGAGIRYTFQKGTLCKWTSVRIVDFWIKSPYKLMLEIDGTSHIGREEQDRAREAAIRRRWKIRQPPLIRVTNKWVFEQGDNLGSELKRRFDAAIADPPASP
jgi:very-short-patch-repair endonuclease